MSYCVSHGKDKAMFLTEDDLKGPSSIVLPETQEPRGFVLPNGEINWGCPCLGNAAIGPCSVEFRESLSCFHESTADPKGSDCIEQFREMSDCMARYPVLYKRNESADAALDSLEEDKEVLDSMNDNQDSMKDSQETTSTVANLTNDSSEK